MFRIYSILFFSLLIVASTWTAESTSLHAQASDITNASKSFLIGVMYSVFKIKKEIRFIRSNTMPMSKIVPKTSIYTYAYNDFSQFSGERATNKNNCISDDVAYNLFSAIDTLIALKEQSANDAVMIKHFKANPTNVFPTLAAIAQQVDQSSASRHIAMPLIFFNYAFTSEFQLFNLANIIARHLRNAKSDYHDYFCAVRKMFIARDYSTIEQVYDKYPKEPLSLPDKEGQRKIATKTLSDSIQDMQLIIDKLSLDDIDDKFECSRLLNNCRSRHNGSRKTLNSSYKITNKKDTEK